MNKLFIIGLPRTGTTSVSVALLNYHFKVAHTAFTKRAFELAEVISDAPCFSDYQQLDVLFPGSKFVYLNRPLEGWLPSITRLLIKMQAHLDPESGYFNPVLKRSFNLTFKLSNTAQRINDHHLTECYLSHHQEVFKYFDKRDDLLTIDLSQSGSFKTLLAFLDISAEQCGEFPTLNTGKQVDSWKQFKHPNKVNANSAGKEHRKFFDYISPL
jgi:hypothetical protein